MFGAILAVISAVKSIAKPVANAVNGIIQSLDSSSDSDHLRNLVVEKLKLKHGLNQGISYLPISLDDHSSKFREIYIPPETKARWEREVQRQFQKRLFPFDQSLDASSFKDVKKRGNIKMILEQKRRIEEMLQATNTTLSEDEKEEASRVLFTIKRVQEFIILQNEIPLLGYDEYEYQISQVSELVILSGESVVQTVYCSPLLNVPKFSEFCQEFEAYKVIGMRFETMNQNQDYSTQTIAYDSLLTRSNKRDILEDHSQQGIRRMSFTQGDQIYTQVLSRIKSLPVSYNFNQIEKGILDIKYPSFILIGSNPEIFEGGQFFETHDQEYPVFGKFHYAVSNQFFQPIHLLTSITYHVIFKKRIDPLFSL